MGVLPDWCCSLQHVAFFACSEGLFWVAHLLERSAISGADVSWEPFNWVVPSGLMAWTRALECGGQGGMDDCVVWAFPANIDTPHLLENDNRPWSRCVLRSFHARTFQVAKWFQLWIVKMPAWTQDNLREQMDCRLAWDGKAFLRTVRHLRIRTSFF